MPNSGLAGMTVSAQRPKAIAQLLREERRLFERGEVTATVELVPMDEAGEEALGPAARRGDNLPGEDAASYRKVDDAAIVLACDARMLKVDPRGRRARIRQPVERDDVEHLVTREHGFGI